MKTMAIRLDDDVSAQLTVVAQLRDTSVAEEIREAISARLELLRSQGDLTARAESVLADIDREAASRRSAIETLFGTAAKPEATPRKAATPKEPMGFAPPPGRRSR